MRITITSIAKGTDGHIVDFVSPYGNGRGRWIVGLPVVEHEYDVEFDFDDSLIVGENLRVTDANVPQVHFSLNQTTFIAKVEDVFDNDTASLRLGDSLILVEYEGAFPDAGTWVEITPARIELADTHV